MRQRAKQSQMHDPAKSQFCCRLPLPLVTPCACKDSRHTGLAACQTMITGDFVWLRPRSLLEERSRRDSVLKNSGKGSLRHPRRRQELANCDGKMQPGDQNGLRSNGGEQGANFPPQHEEGQTHTWTVSSKAGLYLKVGWAGRPPAERPAIHWEETPSMLPEV
jgi:hypothetical protein